MQTLLTPATLKTAEAHIAAADKIMGAVIARHAGAKLARRQPPFHVLATSIINQQCELFTSPKTDSRPILHSGLCFYWRAPLRHTLTAAL